MAKLPDFKDWRWPFPENKDDIDLEKLAKLVYNARLGEQTANEKVKDLETANTQLTTDLAAAKDGKVEGDDSAKDQEIKDLRAENRKLTDAAAKLSPEAQAQIDRLTVGIERGLSLATTLRLQGATKEELDADAVALAKEYDIPLRGEDGDDGDKGGDSLDFTAPIGFGGRPRPGGRRGDRQGGAALEDPSKLELPPLNS